MPPRVPGLGLLARLGLGAAIGAIVLAGALTLDIRIKPRLPNALAQAAGRLAAGPRAPAASTGKVGLAKDEVTGSIPATAAADAGQLGPVSGLPIPRFVSLKTDRVNVRQGPSRAQQVSFIFQRADLPVEVLAEFENWRRIRDSDGSEGWVLQSLLSGRRTALVAPWSREKTLALRRRADASSPAVAMLQPGVLASVKSCESAWCRIAGDGFDGFIEQQKLWGAYPGETIE